jgi:hypothetical protein
VSSRRLRQEFPDLVWAVGRVFRIHVSPL